jgi:hypothetical protein
MKWLRETGNRKGYGKLGVLSREWGWRRRRCVRGLYEIWVAKYGQCVYLNSRDGCGLEIGEYLYMSWV